MKRNRLALLALLSPALMWGTQYFEQSFSSEDDLLDMTFQYQSQVILTDAYYRNLPSLPMESRWFVSRVGNHGFCALIGSHSDTPSQPARMIAPAVMIEEGAAVRWSARSLLPRLPEAYAVLVRKKGTEDWTPLFETSAESAQWQDRAASLDQWVGQEVEVAIECRSTNSYLLAIDDLKIGTLPKAEFAMRSTIPAFITPATNQLTLTIQNIGCQYYPSASRLYLDDVLYSECTFDGNESTDSRADVSFKSGDTFTVSHSLNLSHGQTAKYKITITDKDGKETAIASGSISCNDFEKYLFVDKSTGTWCSNCPTGDLSLQKMTDIYGPQLIAAATHTGDIMSNTGYFSSLGFSSAPYFTINRNPDYNCDPDQLKNKLADAAAIPTNFGINAIANTDGNNINLSVTVVANELMDNSSDNYRVGCVLLGDFIDVPASSARYYRQSHSVVSSTAGDYLYYLPDLIPIELWEFRHSTLTDATAFDGIPQSLPASIQPWKEMCHSYSFPIPEKAAIAQNLSVVAFILDTTTGLIANSCLVSAITDSAAIFSPVSDNDSTIQWFTLQGLRIDSPSSPGIYIRRQRSHSQKIRIQ